MPSWFIGFIIFKRAIPQNSDTIGSINCQNFQFIFLLISIVACTLMEWLGAVLSSSENLTVKERWHAHSYIVIILLLMGSQGGKYTVIAYTLRKDIVMSAIKKGIIRWVLFWVIIYITAHVMVSSCTGSIHKRCVFNIKYDIRKYL